MWSRQVDAGLDLDRPCFDLAGFHVAHDSIGEDASEGDFLGRGALERRKSSTRRLVGLKTSDPKAIPRPGYVVRRDDNVIGEVKSGTFSPSLGAGIALASLDPWPGPGRITIECRGRECEAAAVKGPFYTGGSLP